MPVNHLPRPCEAHQEMPRERRQRTAKERPKNAQRTARERPKNGQRTVRECSENVQRTPSVPSQWGPYERLNPRLGGRLILMRLLLRFFLFDLSPLSLTSGLERYLL